MPQLPLAGVDVAILVGGQGTRLRDVVADLPKPLAPVLGRPFLFYILDALALRGARSVTLCCGYLAEIVGDTVGESWLGMPVYLSVENEPLGTGGALALAEEFLQSDRIVVMNGDSWLTPDWGQLLAALGPDRTACLALAEVPDCGRFGSVDFRGGLIRGFHEKSGNRQPGRINGGVYVLAREVLNALPRGSFSLERDVFPVLASKGSLGGIATESDFLDIGVPESYASAGAFFTALGTAPNAMFLDAPAEGDVQVKLGTCAVVVDGQGRILLEKRRDCGWWCLPGGRLDPGETLATGTIREVHEETGLSVEIVHFVGVFSNPRRRIVCYPDNRDLRHIVDVAVLARPVSGALLHSTESLDLRWFPPAEIPLATVPPVIEILRAALSDQVSPLLA